MKGFLILETGEAYEGRWCGGSDRAGEVVFNTSHSGYEEIATDPSYFSQIIVMTAPMQGNYGVDSSKWESRKHWIEGFVSLQMQQSERDSAWCKQLDQLGIAALSEVDTRSIAIRLRSKGTPWGALICAESEEIARSRAQSLIEKGRAQDKDWVWAASRREVERRPGRKAAGPRVAVLDLGSKENILRELEARCSEIVVFPSRANIKEIMAVEPDALMLTNGPGDPADVKASVETVREAIGRLPIYGICMGHQILALALGAQTYKLKFGHRGSNHPIRDEILKKVYMTSQNHGYAIKDSGLAKDVVVTHRNLNDGTIAGFYSEERKFLGIQFHPESHPGPHDAVPLFDFFVFKVIGKKP